MNGFLKGTLMASVLASASALAVAREAVVLNDGQLDAVTAGVQYSMVHGTSYADAGTVEVRTSAGTVSYSEHYSKTKAMVKVKGTGSGLVALASGESGAGTEYSGAFGVAVADQGKVRIHIKTMSVVHGDDVMTKTKIQVKASGSGAQTYTVSY